MKRILKISSFLIAILCVFGTVQAQKFGYVNSAEILAELPEVKQADANLEALQKQLQKKGQGMVEKLQQDFNEIRQKVERGELSPVQQQEEERKLQERQQEIAKFEQDMVTQLQEKRAELLQPILDRVNDAIKNIATEQSFQFIFDYSSGIILYADDAQNVNPLVKAKLGL